MAQQEGASAAGGGAAARSSRVPVALTDQQWTALAPLVPGAEAPARGRVAAPQSVVEGILFALRNGMGMQSVPPPYPSGSTLYRRYTAWTANGQWDAIWAAFLNTLSPDERRVWIAAAQNRPGSGAEAPSNETAVVTPQAERAVPSTPRLQLQPAVPLRRASQHSAAANGSAPASAAKPSNGSAAPAAASAANGSAPTPVRPLAAAANGSPERPTVTNGSHERPAPATPQQAQPPAPTDTPAVDGSAADGTQLTVEAAGRRVSERLQLSPAESEIVRRRIGDHGVAAALVALDEVERRVASGMMRGVGGMPMSAFEIWVCAIGLARRPVERPRQQPRPERNERVDSNDRDRSKRHWRKMT